MLDAAHSGLSKLLYESAYGLLFSPITVIDPFEETVPPKDYLLQKQEEALLALTTETGDQLLSPEMKKAGSSEVAVAA